MKRIFLPIFAAMMTLSGGMQAASYSIYPIPQSMTSCEGSVNLTAGVRIVASPSVDQATIERAKDVLTRAGVTLSEEATAVPLYLGVAADGSEANALYESLSGKTVAALSVSGKFDCHALVVGREEIVIVGEHTNAVFYGLASLEQMLEQSQGHVVEGVSIHDYADQQNRGIVEGYYGYPYSVSVKKDLMRFMMRYKMNTYLYGAKSDPYHSQYWKDAYPTTITAEQEKNGWLSQTMVEDLSAESASTKVNFIWAIHPGNNFLGSTTVISDIMQKFDKMHQLGVRQFAVFVDDVSIPSSDSDMKLNADRVTALQKAIEQKWNTAEALATDTVRPLHFVPQIYCSSFASSEAQRKSFMAALGKTPSYVTVYTTGQGVWTVPNSEHMANMNAELGRDMAWWWNYPCNDNADGQIYTMDMYSNFYDLPSVNGNARMPRQLTNTIGVVANPMQEGEVAKTSLFSVADYAWNNSGFDNEKSWEASFEPLISIPSVRESYRYIAHYLRWNEPSSLKTLIDAYKSNDNPEALITLMQTIVGHCEQVETLGQSDVESDRLLYADVRPWLLKLKDDCRALALLLQAADKEQTISDRWTTFIEGARLKQALDTATIYTAYALEGMGNSISVSKRQAQVSQLYLEPFIPYVMANAMSDAFTDLRPATKATYVTNRAGARPTVSTTNGVVSMSLAERVYQPGEYVAIQLAQATRLQAVEVSDTLLAGQTVVWSGDGLEWQRFESATTVPSDLVRYVMVINDTQSPRAWKIGSKSIRLTLPVPTTIADATIPEGAVWQSHGKEYIMDGDYSTFCTLNRCQQANDAYMVDLGQVRTIHDVRICMGTTNGDYMREGRVQVSEDGDKWYALRVKGVSDSFSYTLDMPQNVRYNDDMTYCDFDGRELQARYVRLSVKSPNTEKWLRLYEIEVNRLYDEQSLRQTAYDGMPANQPNAIDGNGATCLPGNAISSLTLRLDQLTEAESVTIYADPLSVAAVPTTVSISTDGQDWTTMGQLTTACETIALTDAPMTRYMRFAWEGNTAPAIYELQPLYRDTSLPIETALMPVWADSQTAQGKQSRMYFDIHGRQLPTAPTKGLYIRGGKVYTK